MPSAATLDQRRFRMLSFLSQEAGGRMSITASIERIFHNRSLTATLVLGNLTFIC